MLGLARGYGYSGPLYGGCCGWARLLQQVLDLKSEWRGGSEHDG